MRPRPDEQKLWWQRNKGPKELKAFEDYFDHPLENCGTAGITVGHGYCYRCAWCDSEPSSPSGTCHHNGAHANCKPAAVTKDTPALPEDLP